VPSDVLDDISRITDSIPGMYDRVLHRDTKSKKMPSWAKEYFEKLEAGNKD
jgi:hypothetical protein